MRIFIELNQDNEITGWIAGDYPLSDQCIEIDIPENHGFFMDNGKYRYINGELVEDTSLILKRAKARKITEIDRACNEAILSGFPHSINGDEYWFSYDKEAQFNFVNLWELFRQNVITQQMWTAKDSNGEYARILIDKELMRELLIVTSKHVSKKVAKFRDYYMNLIIKAQSLETLELITWETDSEIITKKELQIELDRMNSTPSAEELQAENDNLRGALLELSDLVFSAL